MRLNNDITARLEILGSVHFNLNDPNTPYTLECRVYGDDTLFDDYLFLADQVQFLANNGGFPISNPTVPCTTRQSLAILNEDRNGTDEIYARLILHQFDITGPAVAEARTNVWIEEFE
ncbi:MAG: hypothetical protein GFH27_549291n313 [Chloroflexi bacterium AL-W]|nr:hypothetical protein [Chloroflexi bacterium AL-N1]NOK67219.1 hypothetical protein [Chloroflexi bacterium AL-N10]NOK75287.1 hypothetical protein [Chloroflexi bacterium AL-N5]NOK82075.1 hypothetical protein [Chloroflexi bacterium AL-W]NOK89920.1 hypothetical protein [Chloroflexi bacterium AL-N15]